MHNRQFLNAMCRSSTGTTTCITCWWCAFLATPLRITALAEAIANTTSKCTNINSWSHMTVLNRNDHMPCWWLRSQSCESKCTTVNSWMQCVGPQQERPHAHTSTYLCFVSSLFIFGRRANAMGSLRPHAGHVDTGAFYRLSTIWRKSRFTALAEAIANAKSKCKNIKNLDCKCRSSTGT